MVKVIIRRRVTIKQIVFLLVAVLCLCFGAFFHPFTTISLSIAIDVVYHFHVPNVLKHKHFKLFIAVLYFALFYVLMMFAFREDMVMTNFFFGFCVIVQSVRLLRSDYCFRKFIIHVLHASSLLFLFHTYIYEVEYLHYVSSCILSFMHPYMT